MSFSYQTIGATTNLASWGVTIVDCEKQVRSWRLLSFLMELLIPSCYYCAFIAEGETNKQQKYQPLQQIHYYRPKQTPNFTSSSTIKGTIFGFRRGKVSLCIQKISKLSTHSIVLLELAVSTTALARKMKGGILRIGLDCSTSHHGHNNISQRKKRWYSRTSHSLLSTLTWTMYCNGRKVGYATRRRPCQGHLHALRLMSSVVTGAGIINGKELHQEDELMYLKANFERVYRSSEAVFFHLIDPDGNMGQELSVFFFRSIPLLV